MTAAATTPPDLRRDQRRIIAEIAVASLVAAALWFAVDRGLPPLAGMTAPAARLVFAGKCLCLAILFTFVTGIEAVAHERLGSPAIDPLVGFETPRLKVNLRYLQHTLEQLVVFAPALLGLA